ncbi:MAG: 2-keto-4-pentenoate hydratase [Hyphomicrobiaceae bacterium]
MTPDAIERLAAELSAARTVVRFADLSSFATPLSVADAYAVQTATIALSGGPVRGWKVTALATADQQKFGSDRPVSGPLLDTYVSAAPARLRKAAYLTPLLECEIAYVLARDLPAREAPYSRAEVEAAIGAVMPVFEIVDARVEPAAPELAKLADCIGNGAFVTGPSVSGWRAHDLAGITIALSKDGKPLLTAPASKILGDPVLAVIALANAQPIAGALKAGQVITTGSCNVPAPLETGRYVADFGPLGTITADVA